MASISDFRSDSSSSMPLSEGHNAWESNSTDAKPIEQLPGETVEQFPKDMVPKPAAIGTDQELADGIDPKSVESEKKTGVVSKVKNFFRGRSSDHYSSSNDLSTPDRSSHDHHHFAQSRKGSRIGSLRFRSGRGKRSVSEAVATLAPASLPSPSSSSSDNNSPPLPRVAVQGILPNYQTLEFEKLKLDQLISPDSIQLNSIIPSFDSAPPKLIEGVTLLEAHGGAGPVVGAFAKLCGDEFHIRLTESNLGAAFVNNYPPIAQQGFEHFCDAYRAEIHNDNRFSVIADGCGWGIKSKKAAQCAVAMIAQSINYGLSGSIHSIATTEDLAHLLVRSLAAAHRGIVSDSDNVSEIGTTTANICFAFTATNGGKYLLVTGVGDCKSMIVTRHSSGEIDVHEIFDPRQVRTNAKDPGGRLGPYVGENGNDPDLRNLWVTCVPLSSEHEQIILNMSDGVHDNFNPEKHGKLPHHVDCSIPESMEWNSPDLGEERQMFLFRLYQNNLLRELIMQSEAEGRRTLDELCYSIVSYCYKLTSPGRAYLTENPTKREPSDTLIYPGKMDHCSITAFRV